jgi:hypothetical protein
VSAPFTGALKFCFGLGTELRSGSGQLLDGFLGGATGAAAGGGDEGLAFVAVHEAGGFEQAGFFAKGDGEEAVFVCVDELAGLDFAAEDFDLDVPTNGRRVGMADTEAFGEGFETGVVHFIEIADAAIGYGADAAEGFVRVAVYLAPEGADDVGFIKVLHDDYFGAGDAGDVTAVIEPGVGILFVRCVAGFDNDGDGVADHRTHVRHEVAGLFEVESIAGGVVFRDLFPAVVDGGSVPAFELEKIGMGQRLHVSEIVGLRLVWATTCCWSSPLTSRL